MLYERLRFRDIRNTSTFRLTILLGLVFAIGVVALLGLIYGLSARELNERSDRILRTEALRLQSVPAYQLSEQIRVEIARTASGFNYFALLSPTGERIVGNMRGRPGLRFNHPEDLPPSPRHGPIRVLAIPAASGGTILIGRDISPFVDLRRRVLEILVVSGLLIALLVLVAGVALSIAPLRRVQRLQRSAHDIAAGNLDARMPILGRGDELDLFAGTVNGMVEEVGRVVAQVKAVTDAVAHDLRTPLTRVRSQIYRARQTPDIDAGLAGRVDTAMADLDAVLERFAALLRISELEASRRRAGFGTVALNPLIGTICELYEPLAEERGIAIACDGLHGATVHGDEKLLFEAIGNLLDNAIKFAPVGGRVAIAVKHEARETRIEVRDDGPGIPAEQRSAVLRRFHRGHGTEEIPGTGLGLSVVAAIVHLHQFVLEFDDAGPGLIVRIRCPD
jgi:signal transduction histidine kinase